jgi:hypothetical protein
MIRLNLSHAATVAGRVVFHLQRRSAPAELLGRANHLAHRLAPYRDSEENPPEAVPELAEIGRKIVEEIERLKIGDDRLGQTIRNLFECLELSKEGAELSLRAGENPRSPLRP